MSHHTKIRKTYNYLISAVILLVTWGFIYHRVFHKSDLQETWIIFTGLLGKPKIQLLFILALILVPVNWGLETAKWKYLVAKIEKVSFIKSFEAVLTGVSVSTFTPNRIGEYFGRIFILEKASRIEGILITILGSMSQLLITILTGTFCLIIFIPAFFGNTILTTGYFYYGMMSLAIAIDVLLLLLYFNISFLSRLNGTIVKKWFRKFRKFLAVFSYYNGKELCWVISMSFLRYLVFSMQYYILLQMFSVPVPLMHALVIIPVVFFVISAVPSIALTDLGIRGSIALYFFTLYFEKFDIHDPAVTIGILSGSTLLWAINIALPALTGSVFLFRLKFFRRNGNGK